MKTAILTFQDAENYGAALQSYALKTACESFSETDVINYYNEYFHRDVSGVGIKSAVKRMLNYTNSKRKTVKFEEFQKNYIVGTAKPIKRDMLRDLNKLYNNFITGSDQVWNLECSGNDTSYFLDFVTEGTKNSYAASFGAAIGEDKIISNLLKDYRRISVREKTGQRILEKVIGKTIPVVLDPIFLLDMRNWAKNFGLTYKEEYVLVYEVLAGSQLFEQAKKFARSNGLEVICITSSDRLRIGARVIKDAGPIEWLKLFSGAAYVFTNSFHGVAFSLNFNKQFFVELLPPPAKTNTRIIEMLETVNLLDRASLKPIELSNIKYNEVNYILDKKRQLSLSYLKSLFEGEHKNEC